MEAFPDCAGEVSEIMGEHVAILPQEFLTFKNRRGWGVYRFM